jgi:hypothetical protein
MTIKMENQYLVSTSRQCSSTPVGFGQGFLNKKQCENTGASPTPDMGPAEFYLFRRLKSALKRRRFCDATDVIKKCDGRAEKASQNGFQECFQHLYSRWQTCMREM